MGVLVFHALVALGLLFSAVGGAEPVAEKEPPIVDGLILPARLDDTDPDTYFREILRLRSNIVRTTLIPGDADSAETQARRFYEAHVALVILQRLPEKTRLAVAAKAADYLVGKTPVGIARSETHGSAAAEILSQISKQALPHLERLRRRFAEKDLDPAEMRHVLAVLGELKDRDAVPIILGWMTKLDEQERRYYLLPALGKIGGDAARAALETRLRGIVTPFESESVLSALGAIGDARSIPAIAQAITGRLGRAAVAQNAAELFAGLRTAGLEGLASVARPLHELTKTEFPSDYAAATGIAALGKIRHPDALRALLALLGDRALPAHPFVRRSIAQALGEHRGVDDAALARGLVEALAGPNGALAEGELVELLTSLDPRHWQAQFARIAPKVIERLEEARSKIAADVIAYELDLTSTPFSAPLRKAAFDRSVEDQLQTLLPYVKALSAAGEKRLPELVRPLLGLDRLGERDRWTAIWLETGRAAENLKQPTAPFDDKARAVFADLLATRGDAREAALNSLEGVKPLLNEATQPRFDRIFRETALSQAPKLAPVDGCKAVCELARGSNAYFKKEYLAQPILGIKGYPTDSWEFAMRSIHSLLIAKAEPHCEEKKGDMAFASSRAHFAELEALAEKTRRFAPGGRPVDTAANYARHYYHLYLQGLKGKLDAAVETKRGAERAAAMAFRAEVVQAMGKNREDLQTFLGDTDGNQDGIEGSLGNTFSLTNAAIAIDAPIDGFVSILDANLRFVGDHPGGAAYNLYATPKKEEGSSAGPRGSAARALLSRFALYLKERDPAKRARHHGKLVGSIRNFREQSPTMKSHLNRDGTHARGKLVDDSKKQDLLAPYYYYPSVPQALVAIQLLLLDPATRAEDRADLRRIRDELRDELRLLIQRDGLFLPMGRRMYASSPAYVNPLGALALLASLETCGGRAVAPLWGAVPRAAPAIAPPAKGALLPQAPTHRF